MPVPRSHRGFSLIEMVMVVATLGIIAMIAAPRMSHAVSHAQDSALKANLRVLQGAVDTYAAEHNELTPAENADGSPADAAVFMKRLLYATDELGNTGTGIYGPYLRSLPRNPGNRLDTIRVDGVVAGKNDAGWRYDSTTRQILPDDPQNLARLVAMAAASGGLEGKVDGEAESSGTLVVK